jgi:hypothetical protein
MPVKFICDGCGTEVPGVYAPASTYYFEPRGWFSRADKDSRQYACSRECIEDAAAKAGKTDLVAPY